MAEILVELHASGAPEPHRRAWRVLVSADLFGRWYAHVRFGRIGATGRTMRWDFDGEKDAVRFLRRCLRRRVTATCRIGVPYRVVEASSSVETLLAATGLARGAVERHVELYGFRVISSQLSRATNESAFGI